MPMGIIPKSEARQIQLKGRNFQHDLRYSKFMALFYSTPLKSWRESLIQLSNAEYKKAHRKERKALCGWRRCALLLCTPSAGQRCLLQETQDYSRDTNKNTMLPRPLPPIAQMHSFAWSLSLWLSLKSKSFQNAADNHTYSMCRQPINLSHCFIFQSFINHTVSLMANSLLYNILN